MGNSKGIQGVPITSDTENKDTGEQETGVNYDPICKSPYSPTYLPHVDQRQRDFDMVNDTYEWVMEELLPDNKERSDLVLALREVTGKCKELTAQLAMKRRNMI